MSTLRIEGAVAFVTGGASGIGLAIARSLAREGARVAIADISEDWLAAAVADLGAPVVAVPLDVADRSAWAAARQVVEARLGPVEILVNNAGIGPDMNRLDEMAPEYFDRFVAIKLTGTFNGIHTFVPGMRSRRRGHVINTASMAGLNPRPRLGAYTAAMFGVVGLSEVLRAELAPDGVGVSVLCPGMVATRLLETTERAGVERPTTAASAGDGIDPAVVGDLVIDGIRGNQLYLVTHPERRPEVEQRMTRVLDAFDRPVAGAEIGDRGSDGSAG